MTDFTGVPEYIILQSLSGSVLLPGVETGFSVTTIGVEKQTKMSMSGIVKFYGRLTQKSYAVKLTNIKYDLLNQLKDYLISNSTNRLSITGVDRVVVSGYVVTTPIDISWDDIGERGSISFSIVGG